MYYDELKKLDSLNEGILVESDDAEFEGLYAGDVEKIRTALEEIEDKMDTSVAIRQLRLMSKYLDKLVRGTI